MNHSPHSHSVLATPPDLRRSVISRRVSTSGSLAIVLSEMAFGTARRSDLSMLSAVTASRCATYAEMR